VRRWLPAAAACVLAAVLGAGPLSAQQPDEPPFPPPQIQAPPPVSPPPSPDQIQPGPAPLETVTPVPDEGDNATPAAAAAPSAKPAPAKPPEAAAKPPEPPKPVRSPMAILQALDKVTAETLRFAAPIGRRVRYKTLVFTVKACETSGVDDPQPRAAAYVLIESEPLGLPGRAPPPAKQVFRGWMFASAPGLHPLEHPVYDAWLIACSASAPSA
jgi:hypothetical protein